MSHRSTEDGKGLVIPKTKCKGFSDYIILQRPLHSSWMCTELNPTTECSAQNSIYVARFLGALYCCFKGEFQIWLLDVCDVYKNWNIWIIEHPCLINSLILLLKENLMNEITALLQMNDILGTVLYSSRWATLQVFIMGSVGSAFAFLLLHLNILSR